MICLGCGRDIPWDGRGAFCYTCSCGATVFVGDRGLALPASLGLGLARGKALGHMDNYIGVDPYTSEQKRNFIRLLRTRGAIWSWECPACQMQDCPFRQLCPRYSSQTPDDRAVIAEYCRTVRHQDCPRYRELKEQVVAIEATPD